MSEVYKIIGFAVSCVGGFIVVACLIRLCLEMWWSLYKTSIGIPKLVRKAKEIVTEDGTLESQAKRIDELEGLLRMAVGAFYKNDAIDWNVLKEAVDKNQEKTGEAGC